MFTFHSTVNQGYLRKQAKEGQFNSCQLARFIQSIEAYFLPKSHDLCFSSLITSLL